MSDDKQSSPAGTGARRPVRAASSSSRAPLEAARPGGGIAGVRWASRGLLALALFMVGLFGRLGGDARLTIPSAPFGGRAGAVHPLSNPVAPGEAAAFVRPATAGLVWLMAGARAEVAADATAVERTRLEEDAARRFAVAFHRAQVVLLALVVVGAYLWLRALLGEAGGAAAGVGALLLAVSPWHAGMAPFVAGLGDLMALALLLWALAAYSVVSPDRPSDMWALAPVVWLCGSVALLASESALVLVPLMALVDAALVRRGMPRGLLLRKRFLSAYLPLGLLTLFVVAITPLREHLVALVAGVPRQALLVAGFAGGALDRVGFAIPGRDPHGAGALVAAVAGVLLLVAPLAAALLLRRREAGVVAAAALLGWLGAALPGLDPLAVSPTVALLPVTFALLAAATLVAGGRDGLPAALPGGATWGAVLAVALLFAAAGVGRIAATRDPLALYERAAEARDRSPEVDYLAFQKFFRGARVADVEEERQRLLERSLGFLVTAIGEYTDLRASAPDAPLLLPSKAFGAQATILLASGRRDQAIEFLRDLARLEPDVPDHGLRLALLLFARGDRAAARDALLPALERLDSPEPAFLLAMEAARQGDDVAAEEFLGVFLEAGRLDAPQRARALLARGALRHKLARYDAAADDLAGALDDPATAERARLLLLDTELRRDRWDRVRELARQAGDPETIPTFRDAMVSAATQIAQEGNATRALAIVDALRAAAASPAATSDAWLDRGAIAVLLNQPVDALDAFRQAVAAAPTAARPYLALARGQIGTGLAADAERTLRDGLALAEPAELLLGDLASFLMAQQRTTDAINLLEGFLREEGRADNAEAHRLLGAAYATAALWAESAAAFGRAVELTAAPPRELRALHAHALQKSGAFEQAERIVVDLLKEDPKDVARYLEAADLYTAMEDLESAAKVLNVGIVNTSGNPALWTRAAAVALAGQKLGLAKDALAKALAADPAFAPALALRREIADFEQRAAELRRLQREAAGAEASGAAPPDAAPEPTASPAPGEQIPTPPPSPTPAAAE